VGSCDHDGRAGSPEEHRPRWDELGTALLAYGFFSLLASFADPLIPRAGSTPRSCSSP
jgi:hypothetical protein